MKKKKIIAAFSGAALLAVAPITATSATAAADETQLSVVASAASAGTKADDVMQPNVPVAVATALARGFTAAKAPQAVSQAARQGTFLQGIGFLAAAPTNVDAAAIQDAYFDR